MSRYLLGCGLVALVLAVPVTANAQDVTYDSQWSYNSGKEYYYKRCYFPSGAHQYLVCYPQKRDWVYWFNPQTRKFWAACPTTSHPQWGDQVKNGADLFLMATKKSGNIQDCRFPDPGPDGANFQSGTATDTDGSQVALGCPPTDDLP
jgi:hypothetical protein